MGKAINHIGVRYGKAVGIRPTAKRVNKKIVWLWVCDCGEEFESPADIFIDRNHSGGCAACVKTARIADKTTHGASRSTEYARWLALKSRVTNPNNVRYSNYSSLGADPVLINSFPDFLEEIGEYPSDGKKYTVDRIENNIGYFKGNIRWATYKEQSRNRGKRADNKSGFTGVHIWGINGIEHAVASCVTTTGGRMQKVFSTRKYGKEAAILLAAEARQKMLLALAEDGDVYSEHHGE